MDKRKLIIISAVNIIDGGALVVLIDTLKAFNEIASINNVKILCLVNSKEFFLHLNLKYIKFMSFPKVKKRWVNRVFFEYVLSYILSRRMLPDVWFCMHDISANVIANKRFVYCHNPSPFYRFKLKDIIYEPKLVVFSLFYKFLYRIGIKNNTNVFVQQNWIANSFSERYNISNVVVSHPDKVSGIHKLSVEDKIDVDCLISSYRDSKIVIYPAYPRIFKNFEVIAECAKKSIANHDNIHYIFTLNGSENKYSKYLFNKYKHLDNISWVGIRPHAYIDYLYTKSDLVCFPSKLETWGLPISEAVSHKLPLCCADLPYAHESSGLYEYVNFFDPDSSDDLYNNIVLALAGKFKPRRECVSSVNVIEGWYGLAEYILGDTHDS
ncbi:glycosyltransferase [uncultured Tolumonas sp.]|uniref:glycosyltransferase n=1 Tax=uncultured Tolumonas sp. TaxID=263765 RepID=UPI00292FB564|nr:glycosyltransferase [uncultured Tolumonas sp.]